MASERQAEAEARPEMALLCCCARTQTDAETTMRAQALIKHSPDWDDLLKRALRHKVMPLLYRRFKTNFAKDAPAGFMERMRDYFYLNAARNHLLTTELCEVLELFESKGIRAVPYKGPMLAAGVYADVAFRQFSDLDIFIHLDDVAKASGLLRSRGYKKERELTSAQETAFLKIECEHMFIRAAGQIYLDLHWGFAPAYFPFRLDAESMWQRLVSIPLGNIQALSFAPEDLLLILCVNAGKEFWKQLGGLCDVAELTRAYPNLDWEKIMRRANAAHTRRMLFVSLLLARDLLGATIPEQVMRKIEAERATHSLATKVKRLLFRPKEEAGTVSQYLRPAKALDNSLDKAKFHWRLALTPTPEDWTFINLPERFRFLYYLTRPVRLAKKYLLHQ